MKKRILIPCNYSVQSLITLKSFLADTNATTKYDFILLHHHDVTTSISELFFLSKLRIISQITEPEFDQACDIIKNKYSSQINLIVKDVFTGINQMAFNNYIEANDIDMVCIPSEEVINNVLITEKMLIKFIKNSGLELVPVNYSFENTMYDKGKLSEVLISSISIGG